MNAAAAAPETVYSYVGLCPTCKSVRFASVDIPDMKRENAREVSKLIREGFDVERWTVERVRAANWACSCKVGADVATPQRSLDLEGSRP